MLYKEDDTPSCQDILELEEITLCIFLGQVPIPKLVTNVTAKFIYFQAFYIYMYFTM